MSWESTPKLCLIEDDPIMGESLGQRFTLEKIACDWYRDAESALAALCHEDYAAIVSDIRLPDLSGEELFESILERRSVPPTLFITGYGSIEQAVRLLTLGARDYITKPFDLDELLDKLRRHCPALFVGDDHVVGEPVLGISPHMHQIQDLLKRLSPHKANVLVTGESGVGKEHAIRYLHQCVDPTGCSPMIAINCAAFQESLLEAELFGHEKGAFTGAARLHRGVFERAHGGTLLLDEVGEMTRAMQAKLLRTIQERTIQRVGGEEPIPVEVRLVFATNRDLKELVKTGQFREDLFYRINVVHIHIQPLRDREEDILWFARRFTEEFATESGKRRYLSPTGEQYLLTRPWLGNVRELKHTIERACILATSEVLGPVELGAPVEDAEVAAESRGLKSHLDDYERRLLSETLETHHWRITETAEALGISRKNLWEKMRKHGIQGKEAVRD